METLAATNHLVGKHSGVPGEMRLDHESTPSLLENEWSINRSLLGLLFFLGTEIMYFAGLISTYLILRAGSTGWPPPDQPRLPIALTGFNTFLFVLSALTMHRGLLAIRAGAEKKLSIWLGLTAGLGAIFLAIQGSEWIRLVGYGLTFSSSTYGGIFYTLIGSHALHVLAAVAVLVFLLARAMQGRYTQESHAGIELGRTYWFFVVGIWPVLYVLVYLM